jgi:hypothetical protein
MTIQLFNPKSPTVEKVRDPYELSSEPWPPPRDEPFADSASGVEVRESSRAFGNPFNSSGSGVDPRARPAPIEGTMLLTPEGFDSDWSGSACLTSPFRIKK